MLNNVWRQIVSQVEDKAKREFEEILVEKDVVGGLNDLERLVGTAKARREAGGEGILPNEPSVYFRSNFPREEEVCAVLESTSLWGRTRVRA